MRTNTLACHVSIIRGVVVTIATLGLSSNHQVHVVNIASSLCKDAVIECSDTAAVQRKIHDVDKVDHPSEARGMQFQEIRSGI